MRASHAKNLFILSPRKLSMPLPNGERPQRRMAAAEKTIKEIKPEDIRVRILGTILALSEGEMIIDDGSGKLEIFFDDQQQLVNLREGQFVRVVTRVLPLTNGFEARGEVVQNLDGFDLQLWRKAKEFLRK